MTCLSFVATAVVCWRIAIVALFGYGDFCKPCIMNCSFDVIRSNQNRNNSCNFGSSVICSRSLTRLDWVICLPFLVLMYLTVVFITHPFGRFGLRNWFARFTAFDDHQVDPSLGGSGVSGTRAGPVHLGCVVKLRCVYAFLLHHMKEMIWVVFNIY